MPEVGAQAVQVGETTSPSTDYVPYTPPGEAPSQSAPQIPTMPWESPQHFIQPAPKKRGEEVTEENFDYSKLSAADKAKFDLLARDLKGKKEDLDKEVKESEELRKKAVSAFIDARKAAIKAAEDASKEERKKRQEEEKKVEKAPEPPKAAKP
jgi:hypothetical protein